jgi:hypothetical protein
MKSAQAVQLQFKIMADGISNGGRIIDIFVIVIDLLSMGLIKGIGLYLNKCFPLLTQKGGQTLPAIEQTIFEIRT